MADETQSLVDDQKCNLDTSNSDVSMRSLDRSYVSTNSSGIEKRRGSSQSESTWETKRARFAGKSAALSGASSVESVETNSSEEISSVQKSSFASSVESVEADIADGHQILNVQRSADGYHEMDIMFYEGDQNKQADRCYKKERHKEFIPLKDLTLDHLPDAYRDDLLFDYIKAAGDLVVMLKVKWTSKRRSDNDAFHMLRGLNTPRFGSGWVKSAKKKTMQSNRGKKCPCSECVESGKGKEVWGEVMVCTAKHMIFNSEELRRCIFTLFYDDEGIDSTDAQCLSGFSILQGDNKKDKMELLCITHNLDLLDKLMEMCQRCDELKESVREKFSPSGQQHKFIFVISHPHCMTKRVSFGKWTKKIFSKDGDVSFFYDAHTCPGSSGAPVCTLDRDWWILHCDHPHSCGTNKDGSKSGFGAS